MFKSLAVIPAVGILALAACQPEPTPEQKAAAAFQQAAKEMAGAMGLAFGAAEFALIYCYPGGAYILVVLNVLTVGWLIRQARRAPMRRSRMYFRAVAVLPQPSGTISRSVKCSAMVGS